MSNRNEDVKSLINMTLDASTAKFSLGTKNKIRACVFILNKDTKKMDIHYHSANMEGAADLGIQFERWQGCVGKAWGYQTGVATPLGILTDDEIKHWNLTDEQYALTKNIKTVYAEPIYAEQDGSRKIFGVLSFDSEMDTIDMFQNETFINYLSEMATIIGRLLLNENLINFLNL